VFTEVQEPFLRGSLRTPHRRVPIRSDVGMVTRGPFESDLPATAHALEAWLRGLPAAVAEVAARLERSGARAALCDIDALGILAAERAGIPSVLVENFRWDWIYTELPEAPPALRAVADELSDVYRRATVHVQV